MATKARVTLKDVAAKAKVHISTASLALNRDPRIPEATRERIVKAAADVGYTPDAMLSALASYRRQVRPRTYVSTLAWVTNHAARTGWRRPTFLNYHRGASDRARELGYNLEEFWLHEPGLTPTRASAILRARGINGLLVVPQETPNVALDDFEWGSFAAITFGHTLVRPKLHVANLNHFRTMTKLLAELPLRGYRRYGLAMMESTDRRDEHGWLSCFLANQQELPRRHRLPPLLLKEWDEPLFRRWYEQHDPDVIVAKADKFRDLIPCLERMGRKIPEDVGIAFHAVPDDERDYSGFRENSRHVGGIAVEFLIAMLHRHERGVPAIPQQVLVEGSWVEGKTLRPRLERFADVVHADPGS